MSAGADRATSPREVECNAVGIVKGMSARSVEQCRLEIEPPGEKSIPVFWHRCGGEARSLVTADVYYALFKKGAQHQFSRP